MNDQPGFVEGKHYTEYVGQVKHMCCNLEHEAVIDLLLRLIDANEKESVAEGSGVSPWYYERLADTYAELGRPDEEIAILERFAAQDHAAGTSAAKLLERLRGLAAARSRHR